MNLQQWLCRSSFQKTWKDLIRMSHTLKSFESGDYCCKFYFKRCSGQTKANIKPNFYGCQLQRIQKKITMSILNIYRQKCIQVGSRNWAGQIVWASVPLSLATRTKLLTILGDLPSFLFHCCTWGLLLAFPRMLLSLLHFRMPLQEFLLFQLQLCFLLYLYFQWSILLKNLLSILNNESKITSLGWAQIINVLYTEINMYNNIYVFC